MKKYLILSLALCLGLAVFAQNTVSLKGNVEHDKAKATGLLVTIEKRNMGTITDANGDFELQVPTGLQTILFRMGGVMRHSQTETFVVGNKYEWNVKLGPKYSSSHIVSMKNQGREDELEFTEVEQTAYTRMKGTVGFDEMKLPKAKVKILATGEETQTKADGSFEIWIPDGEQTIEFSFTGFDAFTHTLQVDTKNKYELTAKFGPAYTKAFLEKKKAEGTLDELKKSECKVNIL